MKDWESVGVNLKSVFKSLAEVKADITIDEDAESEKLSCLHLQTRNMWPNELSSYQINFWAREMFASLATPGLLEM